ncbi:MAG TPA: FlgO family outer membrane protein [Acidobacteriota bacterium]|nr:FlgO family outer membrane protein [Acidobacteriota bacterium]
MNHSERGPEGAAVFYRFGAWRLDLRKRRLLCGEETVSVTPKVFDTLLALVESPERVVAKEELMKLLWPTTFVEEANITQNISVLRRLLKDSPSKPGFIETIPKTGYRFIHPVEKGYEAVEDSGSNPAMAEAAPRRSGTQRPHLLAFLLLSLFVGSLAAWLWIAADARKTAADLESAPALRLAVLPFRNLSADSANDFLGFSLADRIVHKLSYVSDLILRPLSEIEELNGQNLDPSEAGRRLGVDRVLTGTYYRQAEGLQVSARLVDVQENSVVWTNHWDLDAEGLLTVEDRVAEGLLSGLQLLLFPAERRRLHQDVSQSALAYELYLRGVANIIPGSFSVAVELLRTSLEIDPDYAPAWAQLGRATASYGTAGFGGATYYLRAEEAFRRALELNPELLEAKVFLAQYYTESNRAEEAVSLLHSALDINPNLPVAYWELAYALRYGGLLPEAGAAVEKALELDPAVLNRPPNSLLYLQEYDRFLELLELKNDSVFHFYSGLARFCMGDRGAAALHFRKTIDLAPARSPLSSSYLYLIEGRTESARRELQRFHALLDRRGVTDGEFVYKLAQIYAQLGDAEEALKIVSQSVDLGFFPVPYLLADPLIEPVRDLPDWPAVLEEAQARHESFKSRVAGD